MSNFNINEFMHGVKFLIKGDASEYEVEYTRDDDIFARNMSTGDVGFIPSKHVTKILNVTHATIEPENIKLSNQPPEMISKSSSKRKSKRSRFTQKNDK